MTSKKIRAIGAAFLLAVWVALTGFAWFSPAQAESDSERRELEQMPQLNADTVFGGSFMTDFESYTLDQFPMRDTFRQIKAIFHNYVLSQMDNNEIYIADGYAAEMEYPLDEGSVEHAMQTISKIYNSYIKDTGCKVYSTVVPDKSYYLAEPSGHLTMDYEMMFSMVKEGLPDATFIDITDTLTAEDYYYTDTHWRQEKLLPTAQKLCQAMGMTAPKTEDFKVTALERPFYGVYYGQAALPMDPETMYIMESGKLSACRVFNYESKTYSKVYDMRKLSSKDMYDVYLSGVQPLLRIENPMAKTDRKLVVFRDSFGSSLAPLLVQDYAEVILVDIRYINVDLIGNYVQFSDQDVLFMHSSLVLNKKLI